MAESFSSFANPFLEYRDTLSGGANYSDINDVDNVDDYYDNAFKKAFSDVGYLLDTDIIGGEGGIGGGQVDYSLTRVLSEQEYRGFVGDAPAYLSNFSKDATLKQALTAVGSIKDLTSTEDLQSALSNYYGYDVQAKSQKLGSFGGNLATHTSSSKANLQQFHSLVEPILKEQVSYLQATGGLSYQDALSVAYNRDPMMQALYAKYDVKPYRQTKDGSTYLYDPFSFSEIRTSEVKDPGFWDIAPHLAQTALVAAILGPIAGSMFGSTAAASVATAGATALATGGDPVQAMLLAGIPIGDIPIPFTGGGSTDSSYGIKVTSSNTSPATLNNLTGNLVNWTAGSSPLLTAISTAGIAGGLQPTGSSSTGATPDFNPYINNIAAAAAGTTVEAEEENLNIDLANLAALSQPEKAPVTPLSQAPFDDITIDTTVEAGELPELEEDIAPPIVKPRDGSDSSSAAAAAAAAAAVEIDELKDRLKGLNPSSRQARAIRAMLRKKTEAAMEAANKARIEQANAKAAAGTTQSGGGVEQTGDWARDPDNQGNGWIHVPSGTKYTGGTLDNNAVFRNNETGVVRGEFSHPEDKPENITTFDPSLFADFSRFSNVDVNPNGTYAWDGMTVSPERMEQIVNANPDQFPEPSTATTEGTATDGTTTGDDATGDNGSGGAGGGNGGSGGGGGGGSAGGMFAGAGGAGKPSVTDLVFSDYVKRYEAPELQQRALPLQGYQAPQGLFRGLV
tara:strand:- start:2406 stop:4613 length:2208 start_codon:yes stop_codon:yes gene_type:complete